jgi:hypothetical protein
MAKKILNFSQFSMNEKKPSLCIENYISKNIYRKKEEKVKALIMYDM